MIVILCDMCSGGRGGGYGGGRRDNYRDGGGHGPNRNQGGGSRSRPYWNNQCYYYDCLLWNHFYSCPYGLVLIQAHKVGCLLFLIRLMLNCHTPVMVGCLFCPKVIDLCYVNFCIEADGYKLQMLVGLRCYFRWVPNCYDCLPIYFCVFSLFI